MANLRMRVAAMTHQGKVRANNEDCVAVAEWVRSAPMSSPMVLECALDEPRLALVADGLGGHASGEIASMMVARNLVHASKNFSGQESVSLALEGANKQVFEAMSHSPEFRGMGATVVGVALYNSELCLFNVGDSRGYMRSGDYLRLVSTDDVAGFAAMDTSARTGQFGHQIQQALGGSSVYLEITPHLFPHTPAAGDRFLLCSDGLTDMLDQDGIESCLEADTGNSVSKLVNAALDAGGRDNISVVLIDIL